MSLAGSVASWLGPILLQAGADQLKRMLEDGSVGRLAGGIVEQIAGKLGVQPTQSSIEQAYRDNPAEVVQAVQEVDEHYDALARIEEARALSMQSQHKLQATELGAGLLARIGRPLNTLAFAAECGYLVWRIGNLFERGIPANLDMNAVLPIIGLVVPILTLQAGIIGYDAHQQRKAAQAE